MTDKKRMTAKHKPGMTQVEAEAIIAADAEIEAACRRSKQFAAGYVAGHNDGVRDLELFNRLSLPAGKRRSRRG